MVRTHRFATTAVLVCFVMAQSRGALAASEQPPSLGTTPTSTSAIDAVSDQQDDTSVRDVAADYQPLDRDREPLRVAEHPRLTLPDGIFRESLFSVPAGGHVWPGTLASLSEEAGVLAQRRGYRGRGSGRNDAARAAILLGAVGVIAGTAVLVYSNRPECSLNARENGCGYGTKVAGSAVISAGIVGLLVGALTWR